MVFFGFRTTVPGSSKAVGTSSQQELVCGPNHFISSGTTPDGLSHKTKCYTLEAQRPAVFFKLANLFLALVSISEASETTLMYRRNNLRPRR